VPDFADGSLHRVSFARPGKLFTAHESLLQSRVARLTSESHARVVERVIALLRHDLNA
jgi:mRNA interferase MazF